MNPLETFVIFQVGVETKTYSGMNAIHCACRAEVHSFPVACLHKTSGECLPLNSTSKDPFIRTFAPSNYSCYLDETYARAAGLAPPCPATFHWVADVGCVVVVETLVTYDVAQASCPGGSQLVSFFYDNFQTLADYVMQTSYIPLSGTRRGNTFGELEILHSIYLH
ncbi:uncharacterized protein LOC125178461 [Hyalella azteca]|uniref:Uncharacterized protein LOC125178461 n=1 Tax=Hyalella azteca TaxID=294128 RepID=A0A979FM94_HYAAZ|nr:uncharacterized protein LOC125178461 [Hyalella azteca]